MSFLMLKSFDLWLVESALHSFHVCDCSLSWRFFILCGRSYLFSSVQIFCLRNEAKREKEKHATNQKLSSNQQSTCSLHSACSSFRSCWSPRVWRNCWAWNIWRSGTTFMKQLISTEMAGLLALLHSRRFECLELRGLCYGRGSDSFSLELARNLCDSEGMGMSLA